MYDAADPLARLVAERIALNASDAGITLKTLPSTQNVTVPDIELVRVRLASTDPGVALAELARPDRLALSMPEVPAVSLADVYRAASAALQDHGRCRSPTCPPPTPLSPRVRNWTRTRDGSWQLENVWLAAGGADELSPAVADRARADRAGHRGRGLDGRVLRTRRAFERADAERTDALVAQFRREFARRGDDVVRRVEAIAAGDTVSRMALDLSHGGDTSAYVTEAKAVADTISSTCWSSSPPTAASSPRRSGRRASATKKMSRPICRPKARCSAWSRCPMAQRSA